MPPANIVQPPVPVVEIPLDDTDLDYINELARQASSIKDACVSNVIEDLTKQGIQTVYDENMGKLVEKNTQLVITTDTTEPGPNEPPNSDRLVTTNENDDNENRLVTTDSSNDDLGNIKLHPEAKPVDEDVDKSLLNMWKITKMFKIIL